MLHGGMYNHSAAFVVGSCLTVVALASALLPTAAASQQAAAPQPVWLTAIQPFTGGGWDAGISMKVGAEIMLEEINKMSTLLDGYELKIAWQDGQCHGDLGHEIFLENIFDQNYRVFAPSVPISELDSDRDGIVSTVDTQPLGEQWNASTVAPDPVGLLGPGCSAAAIKVAPVAFKARFPMISNSASRPGLSDRTSFPNFFRTIIPDTHFNAAWLAVVSLLGQTSVVAVIGETENWASMGSSLALEATSRDIQLKGFAMNNLITGFSGLQISYDASEAAEGVAVELLRLKERIVILLMFALRNRLLLCENYKVGYLNAIYLPFGWLARGWWMEADTRCSPEQLTYMSMGFVSAQALLWRWDVDTALSCSANMTAGQFKQEWLDRHQTASAAGFAFANEAASTADAVCMYAQALHSVLLQRLVPLTELSTRTPAAYNEIQEALSRTDFEGVQGRLTFVHGMADPNGPLLLQQLQPGDNLVDIATFRFPNLTLVPSVKLHFPFQRETLCAHASINDMAALAACLVPYADCPESKTLDFSTNTCEQCPPGTELERYGPDGMSCVACAPGTATDVAQASCTPCSTGKYAPEVGTSTCLMCPLDQYADQVGSLSCTPCRVGYVSNRDGHACEINRPYFLSLGIIFFFVMLSALTVLARCRSTTRIIDISPMNGKLIATTLSEHHIAHEWRRAPSTRITISGTGVSGLDKPGMRFRTKTLHARSLELLTPEGEPISEEWCSSMGYIQQPFPMELVDSKYLLDAVPSPISIVVGLLVVAVICLRFPPSAVHTALEVGFGVCLSAMWTWARRCRIYWKKTPIEQAHVTFSTEARRKGAVQRTERGPMRAITASQLHELFDFYCRDFIKQRTMHYVYANLVLPLTAEEKVSYAEFVGPHKVEWFVSHCWATKFAHFVESITKHSHEVPSDVSCEISYWICTFSVNQWSLKEELGKEIKDSSFYLTLQSEPCRGTAMVIDESALPLKRVWCLFEIMTTYERSKSDSSFAGVFLCSHSGVLNKGSASMDIAIKIASAVMVIDLRNADAARQEDKDAIFSLVRSMDGGFQAVNGFVRTALQDSLLEVHHVFEKRFVHFLKTMQGQASMLQRLATTNSTDLSEILGDGAEEGDFMQDLASLHSLIDNASIGRVGLQHHGVGGGDFAPEEPTALHHFPSTPSSRHVELLGCGDSHLPNVQEEIVVTILP